MSLISASNLMNYANTYRVVYFSGRFGGGKTSLAFRLAFEMVKRYNYRYILSNVRSVWSEPFENVVLRDGKFIDAVCILDEGGLFLDRAADAKEWLAFLRKVNLTLLVPSVVPPARLLRTVTVTRTVRLNAWGLPAWVYQMNLDAHPVHEKENFVWWQPSEIFGIYDTLGQPTDAGELLTHIQKWTIESGKSLGYDNTNSDKFRRAQTNFSFSSSGSGSGANESAEMAELSENIDYLADIQERARQTAISLPRSRRR